MSESGQIPVNTGDLPIEAIVMDDSLVYTGELTKFVISPKLDKHGNVFGAITLQVLTGDYEGMVCQGNYLPLPRRVGPDADKRDRIAAHNISVSFGRFCRAFNIIDEFPQVDSSNPDTYGAFQAKIEQHYGKSGKFNIQNQEFPSGSGKMRSGVKDFVFDN